MIDPSLTKTIRLYCDGELSPDEAHDFDRKLEGDRELQRAVVFERTLRKRLDAVLSRDNAPAGLAERIQQSLTEEPKDSTPAPIPIDAHQTAQPTWRINLFAIAAVIFLVVGAVIFGIVFPQIDTMQVPPGQQDTATFFAGIGSYISSEHDRIAGNEDVAEDKLVYNDPVTMSNRLSQHLKSRVTPIDLSSLGYTFFGGGECGGLPCDGPAGHLLFKRMRDDGTLTGPNISLFFLPEDRVVEFLAGEEQRRWVVNDDPHSKCGRKVYRLDFPDTGLVYFLVTCDPRVLEPAADLVLTQLHDAVGKPHQ